MNNRLFDLKIFVLGLALLASALSSYALKPSKRVAIHGTVNLSQMIPEKFSDWQVDEGIIPLQADPKQTELLNKIYNQTLNRTYVNSENERVMLSIAYGGDQSDSMQVHRPEICYPAQGFVLNRIFVTDIKTPYGVIPVKRLSTSMQSRLEPITYWITIGDKVEVVGWKWKLKQLKYGLTGKVPDGMLFRVSSIGDEPTSYQLQEKFINDLLNALDVKDRKRLIGNTTF